MVNERSIKLLSLLILFAVGSVTAIPHRSNDEYQWTSEHVKKTIENKTYAMLYSFLSAYFDQEVELDIQKIRSAAYAEILDNPDYFVNKMYNDQSISLYSKTRIPQIIATVILNYITKKAYAYGLDKTQSPEKAHIIQKRIENALRKKMSLQEEPSLVEFIGKGTTRKVDAIINELGWYTPAPKPTPAPIAVAADLQCQSGLDDALTGKPCVRSTLTQGKPLSINPCGHAPICLSCAKQYVANGVKACPVCASQMDVNDFRSKVATIAQAVQDAKIAAEKRAAA